MDIVTKISRAFFVVGVFLILIGLTPDFSIQSIFSLWQRFCVTVGIVLMVLWSHGDQAIPHRDQFGRYKNQEE